MVAIRSDPISPMDGLPGDVPAGAHVESKLGSQIGHLQDKNAELENRCSLIEGKLEEVLKVTGAHEELIKVLRAENEALKATLDAIQISDDDSEDEGGEDGDDPDSREEVDSEANHEGPSDDKRSEDAPEDADEEQSAAQPDADTNTSTSLLGGDDYIIEGSDDFIEDDLPDAAEDGEQFESRQEALLTALLAVRAPMLSLATPLACFNQSDAAKVIDIFTAHMLEALPELQAQWCLDADGLQATVRDLQSPAALTKVRAKDSRTRLSLDMRYMDRAENAGPQWQEAADSVINTVLTAEASRKSTHSSHGGKAPASVAAVNAIPELRRKILQAFMTTDYTSDWCACAFRHRIAHRQHPPSCDELWAEASALFDDVAGVSCKDIRHGRAQPAPVLLPEGNAADAGSDAETAETNSASEEARQALLQTARRGRAHARSSGARQEVLAAASAARAAGILPAEGSRATGGVDGSIAAQAVAAGAAAGIGGGVVADGAGAGQQDEAMAGGDVDAVEAAPAEGGDVVAAVQAEAPVAAEGAGSDAGGEVPEPVDDGIYGGGDTDIEEVEVAVSVAAGGGAGEPDGDEDISFSTQPDAAETASDAGVGGTQHGTADELPHDGLAAVDEARGRATDEEESKVATERLQNSGAAVDAGGEEAYVTADEGDCGLVTGGLADASIPGATEGAIARADAAVDAGKWPAGGRQRCSDSAAAVASARPAAEPPQPAAEALGPASPVHADTMPPCEAATACSQPHMAGLMAGLPQAAVCAAGPQGGGGLGSQPGGGVPQVDACLAADEADAPLGNAAGAPVTGGTATPGGRSGGELCCSPMRRQEREAASCVADHALLDAAEPEQPGPGAEAGQVSPDLGSAPLPDPLSAGAECSPTAVAAAAQEATPGDSGLAARWVDEHPEPTALLPDWLTAGLAKLGRLPLPDALKLCKDAQAVICRLEPQRLSEGALGAGLQSNGKLVVFQAPPPADRTSAGLYISSGRGEYSEDEESVELDTEEHGTSFYVMLQASRPLRQLDQVLSVARLTLESLPEAPTQTLQEASPAVLAMLRRCTAHICASCPCLAHVLPLSVKFKHIGRMYSATNPLLSRDLSKHITSLQLRHVLEPVFFPSPQLPEIQTATIDAFFASHGRRAPTNAVQVKVRRLLHYACVWRANMRVAALPLLSSVEDAPRVHMRPYLLPLTLEWMLERGMDAATPQVQPQNADKPDALVPESAFVRMCKAVVHKRAARTTRITLSQRLCATAGVASRPTAARAMLRRAARNPMAQLCDDTLYAGGLLPVAVVQRVMSTHFSRKEYQVVDVAPGEEVKRERNVEIWVWPSGPREPPRLYRIYRGVEGLDNALQMLPDFPFRTCADQLPSITNAAIRRAIDVLQRAAQGQREQLGWLTSAGEDPAEQVQAPAWPAGRSTARPQRASAPQPVPPARTLPPLQREPAAPPGPPVPRARADRDSSSDSSVGAHARKRRRASAPDLDYSASSGGEGGPVPGHVRKKPCVVSAPARGPGRAGTSVAAGQRPQSHVQAKRIFKAECSAPTRGRGRGAHGRAAWLQDDPKVQAVVGASLDVVPLFPDSEQAMIPKRVKERLKPWQVDGLRHLFETIILDHDSELWRKHRQEMAAARAAHGAAGCSPEADDAPCHAGGAILAQTMGSGKTLQSIILALLFMAVRAKQRQHSRVVMLVPANVLYNCMHELKIWLSEFTTGDVSSQDGHITLETPDLRLKAWAIEGTSQRDRIDQWYEHGAALSAKEVKASSKRARMLRNKLPGGVHIMDGVRQHGSILVATHNAYRDLWTAGQAAGGSQDAPPREAQALQRIVEGAGVVIIDEAHCIRNATTTLSKAVAAFRTPRRVALSGYPLMNSVDEYFQMIAWACPNFFPDKQLFDRHYKAPIELGRRIGATAPARKRMLRQGQILQDLVRPILHRVTPEELGGCLPPKLEAVVAVRMTELTVALYEAAVTQMNAAKVTFFAMQKLINQLLFNPELFLADIKAMAAGHVALEPEVEPERATAGTSDALAAVAPPGADSAAPDTSAAAKQKGGPSMPPAAAQLLVDDFDRILAGRPLRFLDSPKAKLLTALVEGAITQDRKVLVFVAYRQDLHTLKAHYEKRARSGAAVLVCTMSGNTPPAERQQRVAEFNAHRGPAVFVLTTRACGVGINLTAATRAIIAFPHYNPSHEAQAAARIHRLGQKRPVEIFRIVCDGAYDHKVLKRAMEKEAMAMAVVDGQGVKAIMGEHDRHNFVLHPSPAGDPLDAPTASDVDRATLQHTIATAATAGCEIAKVQLWTSLLAEDKGMKITSKSRKKLRGKILAGNRGQQGAGFTDWQLRNLRQSHRREQNSAAAGTGAAPRPVGGADGGEESGVELSSDDDFDMHPPPERILSPFARAASAKAAAAAGSPAAAPRPQPAAARTAPVGAQGGDSSGSMHLQTPVRPSLTPGAAAAKPAVSPSAPAQRAPPPRFLTAALLEPAPLPPQGTAAAGVCKKRGRDAEGASGGPGGAGQEVHTGAAEGRRPQMSDAEWRRQCGQAPVSSVLPLPGRGSSALQAAPLAPRPLPDTPQALPPFRVEPPIPDAPQLRPMQPAAGVPQPPQPTASQPQSHQAAEPRETRAPAAESPAAERRTTGTPAQATAMRGAPPEQQTPVDAHDGEARPRAVPEMPPSVHVMHQHTSCTPLRTPAKQRRSQKPPGSIAKGMQSLLALGITSSRDVSARSTPAQTRRQGGHGGVAAPTSGQPAGTRSSTGATAVAHAPKSAAGQAVTERADGAFAAGHSQASASGAGVGLGVGRVHGSSHARTTTAAATQPDQGGRQAARPAPSTAPAPPQRRLRPRSGDGRVRDPLAPGDGYWHDGRVVVIEDDDDDSI